jgi:hypothetical protein
MRHLAAVVCMPLVAGVLAFAAGAASADGTDPAYPGSVLHMSVTGPLEPAKVLDIVASGSNAADSLDIHLDYGLDVILVDVSKLPGPCQQSYNAELTNITNNPDAGRLLTFEDLNEGSSGSFQITLPFTPGGSGTLLVCGYSRYVTDDAAWGSTQVTIAAPGTHKPVNTTRPRITVTGHRLACSRGTWSGKPTSYAYRWRAGHTIVARRSTLTAGGKLRGRTVECVVTAKNSAGSTTAASRRVTLR